MYPEILIVPVHKGGLLFEEALTSIEPIIAKFSKVLVSLNSGEENAKELATIHQVLGIDRQNVQILIQEEIVGPAKHFSQILQAIDLNVPLQTSAMLLAHDDIVDDIQFEKNFNSLDSLENLVIFGDWKVTRDRHTVERVESSLSPFLETTPTKWITNLGLSHTFTNISGIVAPLSSLIALAKHNRKSRSGARSEYVIATHKSIKKIIRFADPHITIYEHANQEGANVAKFDYHRDEIRFQIWLLTNKRIGSFKFLLITVLRLFYSTLRLTISR